MDMGTLTPYLYMLVIHFYYAWLGDPAFVRTALTVICPDRFFGILSFVRIVIWNIVNCTKLGRCIFQDLEVVISQNKFIETLSECEFYSSFVRRWWSGILVFLE